MSRLVDDAKVEDSPLELEGGPFIGSIRAFIFLCMNRNNQILVGFLVALSGKGW